MFLLGQSAPFSSPPSMGKRGGGGGWGDARAAICQGKHRPPPPLSTTVPLLAQEEKRGHISQEFNFQALEGEQSFPFSLSLSRSFPRSVRCRHSGIACMDNGGNIFFFPSSQGLGCTTEHGGSISFHLRSLGGGT